MHFRKSAITMGAQDDGDYIFLLELACEEWAVDLPGLFGSAGLMSQVPMPTSTLRHLVETLQASA
jgi:hypothetical protein